MEQQLKQLIEDSEKILVTSHISPDPDAVSSVLLMGTALSLNYKGSDIRMVLEEEPEGLEFIDSYDLLKFGSILSTLENFQPDLLIMLDGNNFERFSRHDGEAVRQLIQVSGVKTAIIDHHELAGADKADVFINRHSPSTVQDVYGICFKSLSLQKPQGYAQITMTGLYADTGGFTYMKDGQHKGLFGLVEELVEAGANIEEVRSNLSKLTIDDMRVLGALINNLKSDEDYSYSFLDDEFIKNWEAGGKTMSHLQRGTGEFLDNYIRNIDGRSWGFIAYRNTLQGENMYSVSLRAAGDSKDVSAIAAKLGGGGHKPAAGAKFEASDINEAIRKTKQAIRTS